MLDIYKAKGHVSNLSFRDLTVNENLNYIKHSLKNSTEAFALFKITSEQSVAPEIPAAILQKIALRSDIFDKEKVAGIVRKKEYKQIIRAVRENLERLDNKQVVDTLFALSIMHKKAAGVPYSKFLTHTWNDFYKSITPSIPSLSPTEIAYLCKALVNIQQDADALIPLIKQNAAANI